MATIPLTIFLQAAGTGSVMSAVKGVASALGEGGLGRALLAVGAAAAGTAIAIGTQAVQAFSSYQAAMVQLQNTTNSSDSDMRQYEATIKQLSETTGKAQTDLTSGMYQIISANFSGADATHILTTATQAAIIANANQAQVTTGLVVTLNSFGKKAEQVSAISNQMFKTLSLGRGNMSDLAGALQTGASLVAHYGVSITDMDATLATLSTGGLKTFGVSMTALTQLLNVMDGKTDMMSKRLHKLGIDFDENKFKTMSYTDQIAYLSKVFKGHENQMVSVLGSKQAATALGILGTQSGLLANDIKQLGNAQELAKEKQDAWAKTQQTAAFQTQLFQTHIQNLMIVLGANLLPIINNVMGAIGNLGTWVGNVAGKFGDWWNKTDPIHKTLDLVHTATKNVYSAVKDATTVIQDITNWFIQWHTPILSVAGAITLFFLPAIIQAGVQATIAGGRAAIGFIPTLITSGKEALVAAAKLGPYIVQQIAIGVKGAWAGLQNAASLIPSLIRSGIEGWQAAGKLAVYVAQQIAIGVKAMWAGAMAEGSLIPALIESGVQAASSAGTFMAKLIPAIISFAAEAITAATTAIPAILDGFVAWAVGAWAVAAANIAAFWPIYLVVAAIIAIIAIIILVVKNWGAVLGFFRGLWDGIVSIFSGIDKWFIDKWNSIGDAFKAVFGGLGGIAQGAWNDVLGIIKAGINIAIGLVNSIIIGINKLSGIVHIPAIPTIPYLAKGGVVTSPGSVIVGENGPELLSLGTGAQVTPLTGKSGQGGSSTIVHHWTINVSTMARSQSEVRNLVDMMMTEIGHQFRIQTSSYNSGGVY